MKLPLSLAPLLAIAGCSVTNPVRIECTSDEQCSSTFGAPASCQPSGFCLLRSADAGGLPDGRRDGSSALRRQDLTITSNVDDGNLAGENWHVNGTPTTQTVAMGHSTLTIKCSYFRFALSDDIPEGSRVMRANLRIFGVGSASWDMAGEYLEIRAEDVANATPVGTYFDSPLRVDSNRRVGDAVVRWPTQGGLPWLTGGFNESSDISSLIQELVDKYDGLSMGANIQLYVWMPGMTEDGQVEGSDFARNDGMPARLLIEYYPP